MPEPTPSIPSEFLYFLEILYRADQDCPILMQHDARRLAALLGLPFVRHPTESDSCDTF